MKKIIALIKKVLGLKEEKKITPAEKVEVEKIADNVVKALEEVKAKKIVEVAPVEEAPKAPKKKKKYYKPKAKSNSL